MFSMKSRMALFHPSGPEPVDPTQPRNIRALRIASVAASDEYQVIDIPQHGKVQGRIPQVEIAENDDLSQNWYPFCPAHVGNP
jgi:hypothetical protein